MVVFNLGSITFEGLKFKSINKYSDKYFENLLEENNREKYKLSIIEQINENIHIKFTYSLILKVLSILGCVISISLGLNYLFIPAIVCIILSIGFQLIFDNLKTRIKEMNVGKKMCSDLVDIIFENK